MTAPMSDDEIVVLSRDGDLALVDLNKPPHNLLDGAMLDALDGAFEDAVNGGCRAIVVASRPLRARQPAATPRATRPSMPFRKASAIF